LDVLEHFNALSVLLSSCSAAQWLEICHRGG
jgi:hypothetical protein